MLAEWEGEGIPEEETSSVEGRVAVEGKGLPFVNLRVDGLSKSPNCDKCPQRLRPLRAPE